MPALGRGEEDRPTPAAVYNWRVYLTAVIAATAAIMIGYDSAFIGSTISLGSFRSDFKLRPGVDRSASSVADTSANIVSTYQAGCFAGALIGYPVGQYLGRKWGLFVMSLIFCVGAGVMLAADNSEGTGLAPIYAGRVIAGLGIGAASNLTPLLISEIAPPAIRGQLVGMYEIGWQIGGLVGFWLPYGVSTNLTPNRTQWLIPFAIQLLPGGLFVIGIPFIQESPRWLMSRGRRDAAIKNLCYLRNLSPEDPYIIEEVNQIDVQLEHDRTAVGVGFWAPFRQVFGRAYLFKRLLIVTSLFIFQNGTGINAVNYYAPTIFRSIGITGTNTGLLTTGVFGVIKTIGALIWCFFVIDRFGRRGILLVGSVGGAISMYIIAGINGATDPVNNPSSSITSSGGGALAMFYLWTIFYAISWNGTPWVVCAETFPGGVRAVAQLCASASNWLWNFVIARATPTMFLQMGRSGYGVYILFGSMQILSIFFVVLLLPETKNIPLEEMDRLFMEKNTWKANKIVMAELQREHNVGGGNPSYLHQQKNQGSEERFDQSSAGNSKA